MHSRCVTLRRLAAAELESSEQSFDLVPKLVEFVAVVPFGFPVRLRRHDRLVPVLQQGTGFGRIMGMGRLESKLIETCVAESLVGWDVSLERGCSARTPLRIKS